MPPVRVLVLVPAGEHSACRQHRPAPRDGLLPLLHRPGQESQRSLASSVFLLASAPLRHMPSAATCRLISLYFYGNLMKGRRALPTLSGIFWAKKPRQRLPQLLSLGSIVHQVVSTIARKYE